MNQTNSHALYFIFVKATISKKSSFKKLLRSRSEKMVFFRKKKVFFKFYGVTCDWMFINFLPSIIYMVFKILLKFGHWHPRHWGDNAKTKKTSLWPCKRYDHFFDSHGHFWDKHFERSRQMSVTMFLGTFFYVEKSGGFSFWQMSIQYQVYSIAYQTYKYLNWSKWATDNTVISAIV